MLENKMDIYSLLQDLFKLLQIFWQLQKVLMRPTMNLNFIYLTLPS